MLDDVVLTVIDQSFASLAGALAFFDDRLFDIDALAGLDADADGSVLLQFTLDLTLNAAGQGFYAGFILGTAARDAAVLAPGGLALLLVGLWEMARRRR